MEFNTIPVSFDVSIHLEGASLYKKPNESSEALLAFAAGDEVKVTSLGVVLSAVSYDDQQGYVYTAALDFGGDEALDPAHALAVVAAPNAGKLTLRKKPSTGAASLGSVNNGVIVAVLGEEGDFTRVMARGKEGYLLTKYLTFYAAGEEAESANVALPKNASGTSVNLREKESTASRILARIKENTEVTVLEAGKTWCVVEQNGVLGHMMTKYLEME